MQNCKTKKTVFIFMLTLIPAVLASCGRDDGAISDDKYEIDLSYTRGPVVLRVAVSRKEITIADHLELLIEARVRDGYVVEMPGFGDRLEQFGIVDYTSPIPRLDGEEVVTSRRYELEPFLSGEYSIPPMVVGFRQEGDSIVHTVESDTLKIDVRSILPEDMAELKINDIAGPASIPADRTWIYVTGGALLVAAAGVIVWSRMRRRRAETVRVVGAHEKAFLRLERLLAENLIDEKRYAEFTERVSSILRQYIEDRFGLHAPERTTEEFIAEAGVGLPVDDSQKAVLRDFLVHCDLVKFAAFEPTGDDVQRTFDTCRDFIDITKKEEVSGEAA